MISIAVVSGGMLRLGMRPIRSTTLGLKVRNSSCPYSMVEVKESADEAEEEPEEYPEDLKLAVRMRRIEGVRSQAAIFDKGY